MERFSEIESITELEAEIRELISSQGAPNMLVKLRLTALATQSNVISPGRAARDKSQLVRVCFLEK